MQRPLFHQRILGQIPYYVAAAIALGAPDREIDFAVPTGNFGNILAAYGAKRIGVPVGRLVVASNRNDILARFLASNDMSVTVVEPSLSPSMDIQVSSNFERLLFELLDRDAAATARTMTAFRSSGKMPVSQEAWRRAATQFQGFRMGDDETLAAIRALYEASGYLADPHSIIGIEAAAAHIRPGTPIVAEATAHPAKFPDAIEAAIGIRPPLPAHLADLYEREERCTSVPADLSAIQAEVRALVARNAA